MSAQPEPIAPSSNFSLAGRAGGGDMRFVEFIALMAWLMALPALTIDMMLTALPDIAAEFSLLADNDRQLMITIYMLGFAAGQLLYGPLSDRYGRRPMLFLGLALYVLATIAVIEAADYYWVLVGRCLQGFAAASPRILAIAIVRDCSVGRGMSRIMSFIMMVFIVVPIFAPLFGAALMQWWDWRIIFWFMALNAVLAIVWVALRLPETLSADQRTVLHPKSLGQSFVRVLKTRQTIGYGFAQGFIYGCVMTYVGSAQQIFGELYALGDAFALAFGAVATVMAVASITNIKLVRRLGMRRISHSGLVGFVILGLIVCLLGVPKQPSLWMLYLYLSASFYLLCLCMPNFNAMAMEPMGQSAGLGSALLGFYTTVAGAILGWGFGQAFDGSVRPLVFGFTMMGLAALLAVLITEKGRLWQAHD